MEGATVGKTAFRKAGEGRKGLKGACLKEATFRKTREGREGIVRGKAGEGWKVVKRGVGGAKGV